MDPLDEFGGHLRTIAEAAKRLTPGLVSVTRRDDGGRTVVYVRMDACSPSVFLGLVRTMEEFCRREKIPPDYLFSYDAPIPRF